MITLNLPGKDPVQVKDRDDMKNKMIQMSRLIEGADLETQVKVDKLQSFFKLNQKELTVLGPEIYMAVKNEFGDILKRLGI